LNYFIASYTAQVVNIVENFLLSKSAGLQKFNSHINVKK